MRIMTPRSVGLSAFVSVWLLCFCLCLAVCDLSVALWDHTQDVQDVGHEEGALSVLGTPTIET